jgi:hypothetical protein
MCDVLRTVAQDPARIAAAHPIAVIAGAAHMPALYLTLRGCGYEKGSVRWFEVLDGVTVPSRSTDGRVTTPMPKVLSPEATGDRCWCDWAVDRIEWSYAVRTASMSSAATGLMSVGLRVTSALV